jgi:putative kinase
VALEHIDPYPWFLNRVLELGVNDQVVRTRISSSEWTDAWRPFLGKLYDEVMAHMPGRFLVGIAGPPGAGKSVFAEELNFIVEKGFLHKDVASAALGMDGFHFPNSYLQSHVRHLPDGGAVPLSSVKGAADTIDVPRMRRYLDALVSRPELMPWPGYSRYTHDVVPVAQQVPRGVNLVLIEGNYMLVNRGAFAGIPEMFHLRIYIDAPAPKIVANLVERHIQGGRTIEEAKEWVKRIDLPNARVAESSRQNADVVIERDTDNDIACILWKGEEITPKARASEPFSVEHPVVHGHEIPHGQVHHASPGHPPSTEGAVAPGGTPPA